MIQPINNNLEAVFIDLDRTLILYDDPNLENNMVLKWLKSIGYSDPENIFFSEEWSDHSKRYDLLGVDKWTYRTKLRPLFQDVELEYKKNLLRFGKVKIAPHAKEFLEQIKLPKALISNSAFSLVQFMTRYFYIEDFFNYIYKRPYDYEDLCKPDCRVAQEVIKSMHLSTYSKIAMIGDSSIDMKFANNSNLKAIAIFNNLKESDLYFKNFTHLLQYFKE